MIPNIDFQAVLPLLSMTTACLTVLLVEAVVKKSEAASFWLATAGLLSTALLSALSLGTRGTEFQGMITTGGYAAFFSILFAVSALFTVILSRDYLKKSHSDIGEFYLLVLFSTLGMMLMAAAADLMIIFLGLELMSIALYVLVGFTRRHLKSNEASLKYFLLGAFATGFFVYGIAMLYGASGTTSIPAIVALLPSLGSSSMFWLGSGLLLFGFSFKIAAVPFHMWAPDVYEGAPTPITGFMSTGAKAAGFAAFILVFAHAFTPSENLQLTLSILAAASMIVGNIVAISQSNLKRMLAYSSVAHAGYMLAGLAAGNELGVTGLLYYLLSYLFMNVGAFGIISLLEQEEDRNLTLEAYSGLGRKRPVLAALMAIFMFSLSGIPPFAGFFGKYYVFAGAIEGGLTWLAIVGVITSVIGAYYYLRVVVAMYFHDQASEVVAAPTRLSLAALSIAAIAVIHLGLFPSTILSILHDLL